MCVCVCVISHIPRHVNIYNISKRYGVITEITQGLRNLFLMWILRISEKKMQHEVTYSRDSKTVNDK